LPFRYPVQYVNRPQTPDLPDFRGYCGRIVSGAVRAGDEVLVLSSGRVTKVREIITWEGSLEGAFAPMSVTLTLADELDISRGDMFAHPDFAPRPRKEIEAMVCWMGEEPLQPRSKYLIKHTTNTVRAMATEIVFRTDIHTLEHEQADELAVNEIGRIRFKLAKPVYADAYADNRATGSFIVIDPFTNITVGAGMIA